VPSQAAECVPAPSLTTDVTFELNAVTHGGTLWSHMRSSPDANDVALCTTRTPGGSVAEAPRR
jgi:hypothetical protein